MSSRSTVLALAAAAALCVASTGTLAEGYPGEPITRVVPFTPGDIADTGARAIARALSEQIGEPVLVENRPGAGVADNRQVRLSDWTRDRFNPFIDKHMMKWRS
jgi:tripartite-type tricarboxylate transporter receptor subunit TctC